VFKLAGARMGWFLLTRVSFGETLRSGVSFLKRFVCLEWLITLKGGVALRNRTHPI